MSHKGVIDPNARVLYISANNKAGPLDGSNGMSESGAPLSTTKVHCRCCMEIRLDYQNGHGHYTSQHPCKSKLWIWRACNRLPETWHTHGRGPEYLVPRREHLPFNKWWRDM